MATRCLHFASKVGVVDFLFCFCCFLALENVRVSLCLTMGSLGYTFYCKPAHDMRGARRSQAKVPPTLNEQRALQHARNGRTSRTHLLGQTFRASCNSKSDSHGYGRTRAAISSHLRLQARLEQPIHTPQRRRSGLERSMCFPRRSRARSRGPFRAIRRG